MAGLGGDRKAEILEAIRDDLGSAGAGDTASIRAVRKRWSRALQHEPAAVMLAIARMLAHTPSWQERLIAFELIRHHPPAFASLTDPFVESLAHGLTTWGEIDMFGVTVAGPAWAAGRVSDHTVHRWGKSRDRWRRRLALVATVALNSRARGGSGDVRRTLVVCQLLRDDRDDMVVKALSWSLRELAKRQPDAVRSFLHRERARLAARVLREVTNKLSTGLKNPRPAAAVNR